MANQIDERVKPFEVKMGKSIASLDSEFGTIRAGRANPHVLDRITVDYYGTPTPLQQVANISVPEARMIQIQPWEASLVKEIEKAIMMSDLGINPSDEMCIRDSAGNGRRFSLYQSSQPLQLRKPADTFHSGYDRCHCTGRRKSSRLKQ